MSSICEEIKKVNREVPLRLCPKRAGHIYYPVSRDLITGGPQMAGVLNRQSDFCKNVQFAAGKKKCC